MATATMIFRRCILNPPEWKGDDQHMGARLYFDLEVEGTQYGNLHADLVQRIGLGADQEFLEVTDPSGYSGPWNLPVFQGLAVFYYRHVIGADGLVLGTKPSDMRFVGYVLEQEMCVQFEVSEPTPTKQWDPRSS